MTSLRILLVPLTVLIGTACATDTGPPTTADPTSTTVVEPVTTATTSAPTTSTTTTSTTTTTTTLPPIAAAVLDGIYGATLSYSGDPTTFERTYSFVADCSVEPCRITGEIETARGIHDVEVSRADDSYTFMVLQEAVHADDARTLCVWGETLEYTITVTEATTRGDVWTAISASGFVVDRADVTFQAEGVDCPSEDLEGSVELNASG